MLEQMIIDADLCIKLGRETNWGQTYTFDICINFKGPLIYGSDR